MPDARLRIIKGEGILHVEIIRTEPVRRFCPRITDELLNMLKKYHPLD